MTPYYKRKQTYPRQKKYYGRDIDIAIELRWGRKSRVSNLKGTVRYRTNSLSCDAYCELNDSYEYRNNI